MWSTHHEETDDAYLSGHLHLRLFARRNFRFGSIINVILGVGLYGVVFIRIGESVTIYSGAVQEHLQQSAAFFMSHGSDPYSAHMRAIGAIGGAVRRQAFLLAYSDCFLALGCVLLSSAFALFFMKKQVSWVQWVDIDVQQRTLSFLSITAIERGDGYAFHSKARHSPQSAHY